MGTEASHKSVLSSITHKPKLEPPQRPPCELTAEPTDAGASRGSDRKLAAAPLTASAFASPDVSQERPLPFVPSSGAGTTHLRWSPSEPPRERGRDWGGHRGFRLWSPQQGHPNREEVHTRAPSTLGSRALHATAKLQARDEKPTSQPACPAQAQASSPGAS